MLQQLSKVTDRNVRAVRLDSIFIEISIENIRKNQKQAEMRTINHRNTERCILVRIAVVEEANVS